MPPPCYFVRHERKTGALVRLLDWQHFCLLSHLYYSLHEFTILCFVLCCCFYCLKHSNNTLTVVSSIKVTWRSKGNWSCKLCIIFHNMYVTINPMFNFISHVSASYDVNSATLVQNCSLTFTAVAPTRGGVAWISPVRKQYFSNTTN